MEKKIEDFLHLYLGCNAKVLIEKEEVTALIYCVRTSRTVTISTIKSNFEINMKHVKPILRPLSDMTEDEEIQVCNICNLMTATNIKQALMNGGHYVIHVGYGFELTVYLLKQGFDLFGLIESNLAIDKTTLK